ncbi:hypothetical protein F511_03730 [Dorcoceras hygrometricum]|uniref:Dystroglycan-like n=1 Tax=Dorcoceras hygrometricum TaxID=472368 RepID=A0A2Z7B924_9LAMI|nr:hypothetical protein F511_03730 [Dorcoceras hygrometricum]
MASSSFTNAYLVDFESVLNIADNEGMQNMFKALESIGLRGFLGCKSVLYEPELEQFFDTALIQGGDITGAISGKYFSIYPSRFAGVFDLSTEGLSDFSDVPKNLVYDVRKLFSKSREPVVPHGKKKLLKYEYRLLNDILAKSITVKAGSFDAVTNERFQMMTAIHFVLKVNWSKVLFGVLEEMVDRTVKKAKGYGAQISVLLNRDPVITMGEATPFPSSKILSPMIVLTYITTNQTADTRGQYDEGGKMPVAIVKRASKLKKKSESTSDATVEIVSEVGAVPFQVIAPTPAVTAAQPPAPKQKLRKRNLILSEGSDDENVEENIDGESVKVAGVNVEEPIEKEPRICTDDTESGEQIFTETDVGDIVFGDSTADNPEELAQWLENYISEGAEQVNELDSDRVQGTVDTVDDEQLFETANVEEAVGSKQRAEELMSIDDLLLQIPDDMLLPLVTAADITRLDLGKEILEEDEPVKGNPARETVELICGELEFLVRLRDQVMLDVVDFFHSFSLNKLSDLDALRDLKAKEKLMLDSAETDSLETAVKRKVYILAKYREMLLRKFVESHPDVRKEVQELNAKVDIMATKLEIVKKDVESTKEAISHQLLEFQTQAQANHIVLTDQLGQLVDYINRGGNAKKGEGESSRGPQPPPAVQIRDSGNAGGSGDAVRTTELTQADIDAANRQILERMMR